MWSREVPSGSDQSRSHIGPSWGTSILRLIARIWKLRMYRAADIKMAWNKIWENESKFDCREIVSPDQAWLWLATDLHEHKRPGFKYIEKLFYKHRYQSSQKGSGNQKRPCIIWVALKLIEQNILPHIRRAILSHALIIETIHLSCQKRRAYMIVLA